jgi:hypothetical protein
LTQRASAAGTSADRCPAVTPNASPTLANSTSGASSASNSFCALAAGRKHPQGRLMTADQPVIGTIGGIGAGIPRHHEHRAGLPK